MKLGSKGSKIEWVINRKSHIKMEEVKSLSGVYFSKMKSPIGGFCMGEKNISIL